jgi:hypothetical protein
MILLDTTTRKLQVILAAAKTSLDCPWVASYMDISTSTFAMTGAASATGSTNGVTAVDQVAAPAASTTRQLKYLNVFNADTGAVTATIRYNDNATLYKLITVTLQIGEMLVYNADHGWAIFDASGRFKQVVTFTNGQIPGTTTNDDAAAGNVGEFVEGDLSFANRLTLTTTVAKTIKSIPLTAGDWDVEGMVFFNGGGTTTTQLLASSINTTTDVQGAANGISEFCGLVTPFAYDVVTVLTRRTRLSLSVAGTAYLVARADFSVSTCSGYGYISARRMR